MKPPLPLLRLRSIRGTSIKRPKHSVSSDTEMLPYERQHKTPLKHAFSKLPVPVYGGRHVVTMVWGTKGIGTELMRYVKDVFQYAHVPVDFEEVQVNSMEDVKHAVVSIRRNGAAIASTIGSMTGVADGSPNVEIRESLDLYLNIVHCKPYCGMPRAKFSDLDIVAVRQNTEGEYAMLEHECAKGVVESLKIITKSNSERIARRAFEFASNHNRKKVTIVHKANIMKVSDGLFLKQGAETAAQFPGVKQDAMLVDNCSMQLVNKPKQFDILLMPNLYGTIMVNILCGIVGGPGLFAGCNYGDYYAVFEPATRNIGIDIEGKNEANPVAIMNACVELLYHLKLKKHALLLDKAIFKTVCRDMLHTPDLGGTSTSTEVVQKIKENINLVKKFIFE